MMLQRMLIVLITSVCAYTTASAWQLLPQQSKLTFTATQNNAPVSGQFKTFSLSGNFDPAALASSKVRVVVETNSLAAPYGELVTTLKSADWLSTKIFPQAVFVADHFTHVGGNRYAAKGKLTLRDKTLPVTLNFVLQEYSKSKARAQGELTIKRNQFGIGQGDWAKTDEVKDDVRIDFAVTMVQ